MSISSLAAIKIETERPSLSSLTSLSSSLSTLTPRSPPVHIEAASFYKNITNKRRNISFEYEKLLVGFNKLLIESINELNLRDGFDINLRKMINLNISGLTLVSNTPNSFRSLLLNDCGMRSSISADKLYKKLINKFIEMSTNHEHHDGDNHKSMTKKSKSVIINDINWKKFDKIYKYNKSTKTTKKSKTKKSKKKHLQKKVTRIINNKHLCFKELTIKNINDLKKIFNEYNALNKFYKSLQIDPNKYLSLFINKKRARLIMKYYDGEDLDDFMVEDDGTVGFLYENDFKMICKKLLTQLALLHDHHILHCDIKPHNIRIDEQSDLFDDNDPDYYDVNLIDFGDSLVFKSLKNKSLNAKLNIIKGTPGFIAPEIIKNKKYSVKSDMFSFGAVAFFLLTNNYAVIQSCKMNLNDMMPDRKRLRALIKRENDRNRDHDTKINKDIIDFVLQCLWRNPTKRPTAKEALNHKIFR